MRKKPSVNGGVLGRLDRHRPGEQRSTFLRPGEVILDRHAALETTVALAVATESADGTEDEQRRTRCDRQLPGEYPIFLRVGVCLVPGVADLEWKAVGQIADDRAAEIRLRPVRRIADEVVDGLGGLLERRFRTRGHDAQDDLPSSAQQSGFTD